MRKEEARGTALRVEIYIDQEEKGGSQQSMSEI